MTVPTKKDKPMLKILIHDQVKILLDRMDTHPEEFFTPKTLGNGKWDPFMPGSSIFRHFTKVEQYLIRRKYCKARDKIYRQQAYDSILETLVFKEDNHTTDSYKYSAPPHLGTWGTSAISTLASNTLTLGSETLDAETIKHMKEHIKALKTAEKIK